MKKAKRIQYKEPPMKYDPALSKYVPDLPLKKYVKICPKCGSTNISQDKTTLTLAGATLLSYCNDCQYSSSKGNFFP